MKPTWMMSPSLTRTLLGAEDVLFDLGLTPQSKLNPPLPRFRKACRTKVAHPNTWLLLGTILQFAYCGLVRTPHFTAKIQTICSPSYVSQEQNSGVFYAKSTQQAVARRRFARIREVRPRVCRQFRAEGHGGSTVALHGITSRKENKRKRRLSREMGT